MNDTNTDGMERVYQTPSNMLASAIGAEDGQCAHYYDGIDARCTNDATHFTVIEWRGELENVEICADHVRKQDTESDRNE